MSHAWDDAGLPVAPAEVRGWDELRETGLLWLINRTVFHPRGFALALVRREGEIIGWRLLGDGSEVWSMAGPEDDEYRAATETLRPVHDGKTPW